MKSRRLKICLIMALLVICVTSLCSCFDIDDIIVDLGFYEKNKNANKEFTVIFRECAGVTLKENEEPIQNVKKGTKVKFKVDISSNYIYLGNTVGAKYDADEGLIILEDVSAPVTIDLILISKSELYCVDLFKNHNSASVGFVKGGAWSVEATEITVKASAPEGYIFKGWSAGNYLVNNGVLLSTELEYTFTPEERNVRLYANFESESEYKISYDPNGGRINGMLGQNYTVVKEYSDSFLLQQTLYDGHPDVKFTREGCLPIGYSTEPVGLYSEYDSANSITGFSNMGGVCEVPREDGQLTLYVVWAEITADAAFVYETGTYNDIWYGTDSNNNKSIELGETFKSSTTGIIIKDYNSLLNSGSKDTVVIPETIDGKPVIGIAKDAFANIVGVKKIVIPKTVKKIENGAFTKCTGLREVVFFDSLQYVQNGAFSNSINTVVMNSSKRPAFAGSGEGSFCIKYERVRFYRNEKKLIVVSGSSTLNGLNSKTLEKNFNNEYQVVNYGTNAGTQAMFYLDVIANYVTQGDVIVHAPEWGSGGQMGDNTLHWKMFRGNNQCYDIFREVDMSKYTNFWNAYQEYSIGSMLGHNDTGFASIQVTTRDYQDPNTGMNKYGDLLGNRENRTYSPGSMMFNNNQMSSSRAKNLNWVNSRIVQAGGIVLFSFGTADALSCANSNAGWKNQCDAFTKHCADVLDAPVISNVGTYIMGENDKNLDAALHEMYNSAWHCTYYGANIRTAELTYDINQYLIKKTDSWESYSVRETHRQKSQYKTYQYSDFN